MNSGKCNDPGSDRWVIKDVTDCNLGSNKVQMPCQSKNPPDCSHTASSGSYNQLPTGCVAQGQGSVLYLQQDSTSANCASYFYCVCWHGPECSNTLGTEPIGITPCMCGGKICRSDDSSTMYCIKETMQCSLTPRECLYTNGKTGNTGTCSCGTGTCAVMATMHARGLLKVGEPFIHESIVGSQFIGTILEETKLKDGRIGMIPEIKGSSCITQYSEIVVDENDIFPEGYTVSDIW